MAGTRAGSSGPETCASVVRPAGSPAIGPAASSAADGAPAAPPAAPPSIVGHAACAPPRAAAASGDAGARPSCTGNAVAGGSWAARGASACAEALASSASAQRRGPAPGLGRRRRGAGSHGGHDVVARSSAAATSAMRPERGKPHSLQYFAPSLFSEWQFGQFMQTTLSRGRTPSIVSGKAAGSSRSSGTTPFPQQCARGEWRYIAPVPMHRVRLPSTRPPEQRPFRAAARPGEGQEAGGRQGSLTRLRRSRSGGFGSRRAASSSTFTDRSKNTRSPQQLLQVGAGLDADLLDGRALLADDDALLAFALHVDDGEDAGRGPSCLSYSISSTRTPMAWGTSSWNVRRIFSRTNSATITSMRLVRLHVGREPRPALPAAGRPPPRTNASTFGRSRPDKRHHGVPHRPAVPPPRRCADSWAEFTRSVLESTQIFFARERAICATTHSSPRPMGLDESATKATTSTSSRALHAETFSSSPRAS